MCLPLDDTTTVGVCVVLLGYLSVFPGWFSHPVEWSCFCFISVLYFCISYFICFSRFLVIFVRYVGSSF